MIAGMAAVCATGKFEDADENEPTHQSEACQSRQWFQAIRQPFAGNPGDGAEMHVFKGCQCRKAPAMVMP